MGWAISGLPALGRIRHDDAVRYDGTDSVAVFPLGPFHSHDPELRLITSAGIAGQHHESGDLARYTPSPQLCGDAPCYWVMRDGFGRTYYFGDTASTNAHPDSIEFAATVWETSPQGRTSRGIRVWLLTRVQDEYGNYYVVE